MNSRTSAHRARRQRSDKAPCSPHRLGNVTTNPATTLDSRCEAVNHPYRAGLTLLGERSLDEAIDFLSAMELLASGEHEDPDPKLSVESFCAIVHIALNLLRQVSSGIESMPVRAQLAWQQDLDAWRARRQADDTPS